jgi:hypothetical protein
MKAFQFYYSGTAPASSGSGAVPKTVKVEVESELDQSTSSVVSTTSTRGRRKGSAAQKLDAIPKTEPTATTTSGRRSRGVKVEQPNQKEEEGEEEVVASTKRQNGKAANKKIEEIKRVN